MADEEELVLYPWQAEIIDKLTVSMGEGRSGHLSDPPLTRAISYCKRGERPFNGK